MKMDEQYALAPQNFTITLYPRLSLKLTKCTYVLRPRVYSTALIAGMKVPPLRLGMFNSLRIIGG